MMRISRYCCCIEWSFWEMDIVSRFTKKKNMYALVCFCTSPFPPLWKPLPSATRHRGGRLFFQEKFGVCWSGNGMWVSSHYHITKSHLYPNLVTQEPGRLSDWMYGWPHSSHKLLWSTGGKGWQSKPQGSSLQSLVVLAGDLQTKSSTTCKAFNLGTEATRSDEPKVSQVMAVRAALSAFQRRSVWKLRSLVRPYAAFLPRIDFFLTQTSPVQRILNFKGRIWSYFPGNGRFPLQERPFQTGICT